MIPAEWFDTVEPRLIRRENGGWLAVTPVRSPLSIGVEAWSVEDARNRFRRALREWRALLSQPPSLISGWPSVGDTDTQEERPE